MEETKIFVGYILEKCKKKKKQLQVIMASFVICTLPQQLLVLLPEFNLYFKFFFYHCLVTDQPSLFNPTTVCKPDQTCFLVLFGFVFF